MRAFQRKRLFIDAKVQGALLVRVAIYWLCCIVVMNVMLIFWELFISQNPIRFDQLWYRHAPALAVSLLVLPFILFDAARITNRLVGPVYRLRDGLRRATRHEHVEPIQFRTNDFWHDFADEFNALLATLPENRQPDFDAELPLAQRSTIEMPATLIK